MLFHTEKLNGMSPSSVGLNFCKIVLQDVYETPAVLGAGWQKRKLHIDLTLIEHSFSQI